MQNKPWQIVVDTLELLKKGAVVGITTKELDGIGEANIIELGGIPINKDYHPTWAKTPFPNAICISINNELCHGFPSERKLENGDTVIFDLGVRVGELCGDAAITVGIGNLSNKDERLLRVAKQTLEEGIKYVRAGRNIKDISRAIEIFALHRGYVTNENFSGHTIGENMHMSPAVPNFYNSKQEDVFLEEGQMICLEPILTYFDRKGYPMENGWTWQTWDHQKVAMFEKQLRVLKDGCEVLTAC